MSTRRSPGDPILVVVAAVAAVAAPGAAGCRRDRAVASLEQARGAVEAARAERWAAAAIGHVFVLGDAARTGPASEARLRFASGRLLRMGENALVRFGGARPEEVQLAVELGDAEIEGEGTLLLATPRGLARVDPRTRVHVRATGQSTRFEVMLGRAVLLAADGELALGAGEGIEIPAGGGSPVRYQVRLGAAVMEPLGAEGPDAGAPTATATAQEGETSEPEPPETRPAGEAQADRGPSTADVVVTGGESAVIHDRHPQVAVRVRFDELCPQGGVVEIARGASYRRPRQRAGGRANAVVALPPGTHRYRVLCGDGGDAKASGRLTVRRDSGTAPVPRTAPVNVIESDGRRYTVLYQSRLPSLTFVWPGAPQADAYELHIETDGNERVVRTEGARHRMASGTVGEGQHRWWYTAGARSSPRTSLSVAFDNAAATAQLQAPRDGTRWPDGEIEVVGVALEGSRVSVGGQPLSVDSHGRFRGRAPRPGPGERAIAVRLEHPRSGVHYYVRRMAGR